MLNRRMDDRTIKCTNMPVPEHALYFRLFEEQILIIPSMCKVQPVNASQKVKVESLFRDLDTTSSTYKILA